MLKTGVTFSSYLAPTLREAPAEAQIISHQLMLRAGMIRQSSAGIYSWLPLGFRVLKKIEQIVREEQDRINAHEILMPTIQSADLWRQSGRYDDYGKEMLRITDRHGRDMLYGPTNEEQITEIISASAKSWRDMPKLLYHIQWKFRDEIRPRFGVMRGREFLMKDAYSFDIDEVAGMQSYYKMFISYLRIFARLELKAIPMRAETGPIGGNNSHEFIILAETGESQVYCDKSLLSLEAFQGDIENAGNLAALVEAWTSPYAATDDMHEEADYHRLVAPEHRCQARGIEVGHIFFFGDKYSIPFNAFVTGPGGERMPLQMGSYGVGISRLAGALIEACHDGRGILWPESVAPFKVGLINASPRDEKALAITCDIFEKLCAHHIETLYDDRDERFGVKLKDSELIGLPHRVIVGAKTAETGEVEVSTRRNPDQTQKIAIEKLIDYLKTPEKTI